MPGNEMEADDNEANTAGTAGNGPVSLVASGPTKRTSMNTSYNILYILVPNEMVLVQRTHQVLFRKRSYAYYAGVVFTRFCGLWFSVFFENVGYSGSMW